MRIPKPEQLVGPVLFAILFCLAMLPILPSACKSKAAAALPAPVDVEPLTVTYADDPLNPVTVELPDMAGMAPGRYRVVSVEVVRP